MKHRAGSDSVSYVLQWRDKRANRSHRLSLGDARKVKLDAAEKVARDRSAEVLISQEYT